MNGFREVDAAEMTLVEGGGILSFLGDLLGGVANQVGSVLSFAWQTLTHPLRPIT
jgi:hypothetical protein